MNQKNKDIAAKVLLGIGGRENIIHVTHCMTRLRFNLNDYNLAKETEIKKIDGVLGCQNIGGQLQVIIGTNAASVYDVFCEMADMKKGERIKENLDALSDRPEAVGKKSLRDIGNTMLNYIAGSLTPLIPLLIAASFFKTLGTVLGPNLLGIVTAGSDMEVLLTFVGDAGFYYLPVFVGYSASKKIGCNPVIGMLLGAVLIHPTLVALSGAEAVSFMVYGIPCSVQNYTSTIIPMILSIWIMSYVERILKKYVPEAIKVFMVPFGTMLIMLPLSLCLLGPAGNFIGTYVCNGIIALNGVASPLALGIVGATFPLLVMTGMHITLIAFMLTSFPILGFDPLLAPGVACASWANLGVAIACIVKFKSKQQKSLTMGYIITWFFGGVGEPLLYGLNIVFKTPLYATMAAGFLAGLLGGFLNLGAYTLSTANGVYGLASFIGGSTGNYIATAVTIAVSVAAGFVLMMLMPLKESVETE